MPAASLPALEQRLEACLLELEKLHRARPSLPTAMARAEAGQRIDELLDEIAELQRMIDMSPAETLQDAAVKPRRLEMEMISPAGSGPLTSAVGEPGRLCRDSWNGQGHLHRV